MREVFAFPSVTTHFLYDILNYNSILVYVVFRNI
jgi:hypothetical protein